MIQMLKRLSVLTTIILCFQQNVFSQDEGAVYSQVLGIPNKLLQKINSKTDDMSDRITKQTKRYLSRMAREEKKLKSKLAKKDSTAAKYLFDDAEQQYLQWQTGIKNESVKFNSASNKYIPHLDTLQTALRLLNINKDLLSKIPLRDDKLKEAISSMNVLQARFNKAEEVKNFLKHRRQFLQEQLDRFGMVKELQKYKKQVYYYQTQIDEYKKIVNDPSVLQIKAMELLTRTPLFRDFFSKHFQLAGMFSLPGNSTAATTASFTGLQTRDAVQQVLTQRFGSGVNVQQMVLQQAQGSHSPLMQLKDKINQWGGSSSDMEMPDFRPNNQKTRLLKNRLEFGMNLQTVKSNRFFPSTSDIGLSLGYKLNDKSTVGIGGSYKMGWGKDIRHISISHQGVGVRSFVDYKIKGNFWLSGGGEFNYRIKLNRFEVLQDYSAWQRSALLGVSKKYKVSNKLKGNAQVMYDFLWREQVPRTQPVIFRVGYNLK